MDEGYIESEIGRRFRRLVRTMEGGSATDQDLGKEVLSFIEVVLAGVAWQQILEATNKTPDHLT